MSPTFLRVDEILQIHEDQSRRHGGDQRIHDPTMLLSAVAMPQATFGGDFLHRDLFEMGAAYLFHLVQNHPFKEGNGPTGAVATLVFLVLNGIKVEVDDDDLVELVMDVARGRAEKPDIADFLRNRSITLF